MTQRSNVKLTLKLFWQFDKPYRLYFWIGTIGAAIAVIADSILPPLLVAGAFDKLQAVSQAGGELRLAEFLPYLYGYGSLVAFSVILWRLQAYFVWKYEIPVIRNIAITIFDHLQHMGAQFHANRFGGALVTQSTKFLGGYERIHDEFTWSVTTTVVSFLAAFGVLLFTAPQYGAIFIVATIFYAAIVYRRTLRTMPFDRALATSESQRTAKLADMITNASAVQAFAGEKHEKQLFTRQADETSAHYWNLLHKVIVNDSISHSITALINISSFTAGVLAITVFNQPAGALYLVVNYTSQLTRRLWEFNRTVRNLNRAFGDANDMTEILQLEPEIKDSSGAKKLHVRRGQISFDKVSFGYDSDDSALLFKDLDLRIKPGEKVGLVGHSGGGKTTITNLLLRFRDIQGGRILIDNQDIAKVTQTSLRASIAYVPQEPMLFHRSLHENIAYGRPEASIKEVQAIAKMAHADEFISRLPAGYDTLVGERGVKLSGGQRQRVAIARAMLKNAPILLLDEATSALDSESETYIQEALWKLMEGRTAIVIAHRLSTIQKMDRIIVMDQGRIAEQGSHRELIRQNGIYAKLWNHQSGGFIED